MNLAKNIRNKRSYYTALLVAILIFGGLWSCKKGQLNENNKPETHLFVNDISLEGEHRLRTSVALEWIGLDNDGYITTYEYSFDNKTWYETTQTDSIFVFSIPKGKETLDQDFYVRSIDNNGDTDDTPAYLSIPLKNTPPEIRIDSTLSAIDTAFIVASLSWIATDLDGQENIDYIEIKANSGSWYRLSPNQSTLNIVPTDAKTQGPQEGKVFLTGNDPEVTNLEDIIVGGLNDFYFKAVDISGATSQIDTLKGLFIKPQIHDNLLIGEWSFYNNDNQALLSGTGISYDFIDMEKNSGQNQPKFWNPLFQLYLSHYEFVMLYSGNQQYVNNQTGVTEYFLESAASGIQEYMANGGKILISSALPVLAAGSGQTYSFLQVLPIDSIATESVTGSFNTNADSLVVAKVSGYPDLKTKSFKIYGDEFSPFHPTSDATELYRAQLDRKNGWDGPYTVAAMRQNNQGETNQVFFGLPLHELGRTQSNIDAVMNTLIKQEFNR